MSDYDDKLRRPPTPAELEARLSPTSHIEDAVVVEEVVETTPKPMKKPKGLEDDEEDYPPLPPKEKPPNPMKFDAKKTPLRLLPIIPLYCIAKVFGFGARKYAANSWRSKEHEAVSWMRTFDSILNHLLLWAGGQDLDPQSGMPHLWHAGTQLMILIEQVETKSGQDDRHHNEPEHLEGLRGED